MLAERMQQHGTHAWLVNTGYTGGKYGVGRRMSLKHTRAIIDAIHDGSLQDVEYATSPVFGLQVPTSCPNVPSDVLQPGTQWADTTEFSTTLQHLGALFVDNFKKYLGDAAAHVGADLAERIRSGGPDAAACTRAASNGSDE
jgi:phosphoenolpyruvate carboxykinase (ATP)